MSERIVYSSSGEKTYFLDGKEVPEHVYIYQTTDRDKRNFQYMIESGCPPHGISDCTFMKGTANGSQFEGQQKQGNYYRHIAESMGASTTGKKYLSGLAAFPGDPEAWVDSRGDVERLLAKRGWGAEGTINVKPREALNPPKEPEMAPDLVEKYATEIAARDPNPHLVDMDDLKGQVKERMSPKKKKAKAVV